MEERREISRNVYGRIDLLRSGSVVSSLAGAFGNALRETRLTAMARDVGRGGGEQIVLNASGYVTARRQSTVSSKVTGKIVEVLIEEDRKVKAGQVVARLDDTNVREKKL